jgi:hypothetical protein
MKHHKVKTLSFIAIGVVVILASLELMAALAFFIRPTGNPLAFPSNAADLHIFKAQEEGIDVGVKPNYRQTFRSDEFKTTIRTNNVGLRENFDYFGEKMDIATVGNSFAFGHGVEAVERYSDLLRQQIVGASVMSLAYQNGDAPPSYYLFLKRNPRYMPRVLVVGIFPWFDFSGDIASSTLTYDEAGSLIRVKSNIYAVNPDGFLISPEKIDWVEPGWRKLAREFNVGRALLVLHHRLSRESPRLFDAKKNKSTGSNKSDDTASIMLPKPNFEDGHFNAFARRALAFVEQINQLANASGSTVVVIYIPTSYRVGHYPYFCQTISEYTPKTCDSLRQSNDLGKALDLWFSEHGIPFIDPTETFRKLEAGERQLYFSKDGHWTPAGHFAAAELLARFIIDAEYLK